MTHSISTMQGTRRAAQIFLMVLFIICSGWSKSDCAPQGTQGAVAGPAAAEGELVQPILALAWSGEPRLELKTKYPIYNALDNDLATTWVANGQTAILEYEPAIVKSIALIPGYAKSALLWQANRRPTRVRFRLYREESGGARAVAGPFVEAVLAAPATLPRADALWARIPVDDTTPSIAIEIQVVEGSSGVTKSDDICITELALAGAAQTAKPKGCSAIVKTWTLAETSRALGIDLQDRLAAHFDTISFEDCAYEHSFSGGAHRGFAGQCRVEGEAKQGVGGVRYRFEGREELSEGTPQLKTTVMQRTVSFRRLGRRIAVIDGLLFSGRVDYLCP